MNPYVKALYSVVEEAKGQEINDKLIDHLAKVHNLDFREVALALGHTPSRPYVQGRLYTQQQQQSRF